MGNSGSPLGIRGSGEVGRWGTRGPLWGLGAVGRWGDGEMGECEEWRNNNQQSTTNNQPPTINHQPLTILLILPTVDFL
jgi:hypothetical protein